MNIEALPPCVVCGARDVRMLLEVHLSGGATVSLCGSHALMHRRARVQAKTPDQLRELLSDRRAADDRRELRERSMGELDALGAQLSAAFAAERRRERERRTG